MQSKNQIIKGISAKSKQTQYEYVYESYACIISLPIIGKYMPHK